MERQRRKVCEGDRKRKNKRKRGKKRRKERGKIRGERGYVMNGPPLCFLVDVKTAIEER